MDGSALVGLPSTGCTRWFPEYLEDAEVQRWLWRHTHEVPHNHLLGGFLPPYLHHPTPQHHTTQVGRLWEESPENTPHPITPNASPGTASQWARAMAAKGASATRAKEARAGLCHCGKNSPSAYFPKPFKPISPCSSTKNTKRSGKPQAVGESQGINCFRAHSRETHNHLGNW